MRSYGRFPILVLALMVCVFLSACGDSPTAATNATNVTALSGAATAATTTALSGDATPAVLGQSTLPAVADVPTVASATSADTAATTAASADTPTPVTTAATTGTPLPAETPRPTYTPFTGPTVTIAPRPTAPVVPPTAPQGPTGAPAKLLIPDINVNAAVEYVGVDKNNNMDTPQNPWNVAWYKLGPQPGAFGNAVIAGHVDWWTTGPAVFWNLRQLHIGSLIKVIDNHNVTRTFAVRDIQVYNDQNAPIQRIFGPTTDANLNLITCTGEFNRAAGHYNQRLVIFSTLQS